MTPSQLRDGIATGLATIPGLSVSRYSPGVPQPPHAVVKVTGYRYDATMGRGSDDITVQVMLYVSRAEDDGGLTLLDQFVAGHGTYSVKTAVESSSLTGLTTAMVRLDSAEIGTASTSDGAEYLAATFDVACTVSGLS